MRLLILVWLAAASIAAALEAVDFTTSSTVAPESVESSETTELAAPHETATLIAATTPEATESSSSSSTTDVATLQAELADAQARIAKFKAEKDNIEVKQRLPSGLLLERDAIGLLFRPKSCTNAQLADITFSKRPRTISMHAAFSEQW